MLLSKIYVFVWAIVLAGSAVAAPAGSRKGQLSTLGYRTCSKEQAALYNKKNKLSDGYDWTKATGQIQIGMGAYTTPAPGEWLGDKNKENWNCVVQGNKDALDKHPKVWIPENLQWLDMDQTPLYNWAEKTYPKMDFETAFRLSEITRAPVGEYVKHEHTMQLLVPTQVLMDKDLEKKLGLRVECKRNWQDLPIKETVNYTKAWHRDSVFGTSQWRDPPVPASGSASPVAGGSPGKGCFGKCFGGSA